MKLPFLEAPLSEPPTLEHPFTSRPTTPLKPALFLSLDPHLSLDPTSRLDSTGGCGISIPELTSIASTQNHDITSIGGEP